MSIFKGLNNVGRLSVEFGINSRYEYLWVWYHLQLVFRYIVQIKINSQNLEFLGYSFPDCILESMNLSPFPLLVSLLSNVITTIVNDLHLYSLIVFARNYPDN